MRDAAIADTTGEAGQAHHVVREVVGVFDTPAHLEAAVEQLGIAGIDRAAISVLDAVAQQVRTPGGPPRSILSVSDDPSTPTTAFVSDLSRSEARGVSTAIPLVIGGFGAAWAVAAAGGALLFAIGATVVSGGVGAGLGAMLYHAVARRHAAAIEKQLAQGGLILWVRVDNTATEERALAVLRGCGAGFPHTHTIDRPWGVADSPMYGVQPDPFLEHDRKPDAA